MDSDINICTYIICSQMAYLTENKFVYLHNMIMSQVCLPLPGKIILFQQELAHLEIYGCVLYQLHKHLVSHLQEAKLVALQTELRRERYLVYELLPRGDVHSRLNKDLRHSLLWRNLETQRVKITFMRARFTPYPVQFAETPKEDVQKLEHQLLLLETPEEQPNGFVGN